MDLPDARGLEPVLAVLNAAPDSRMLKRSIRYAIERKAALAHTRFNQLDLGPKAAPGPGGVK